jgi:hypothetical protein
MLKYNIVCHYLLSDYVFSPEICLALCLFICLHIFLNFILSCLTPPYLSDPRRIGYSAVRSGDCSLFHMTVAWLPAVVLTDCNSWNDYKFNLILFLIYILSNLSLYLSLLSVSLFLFQYISLSLSACLSPWLSVTLSFRLSVLSKNIDNIRLLRAGCNSPTSIQLLVGASQDHPV